VHGLGVHQVDQVVEPGAERAARQDPRLVVVVKAEPRGRRAGRQGVGAVVDDGRRLGLGVGAAELPRHDPGGR
jgi:hypothetical protein